MALMLDGASLKDTSELVSKASSAFNSGTNLGLYSREGGLVDVAIEGIFCHRSSRGFLTFTGSYRGAFVSIVAIGMGYPNMDFFVREARVIVDGPLVIIRVGTCGCIADGGIGMLAIPDRGALMVQRNYDYPFNFSSTSLNALPTSEQASSTPSLGPAEAVPYRISRTYSPDQKLTLALIRKAQELVRVENVLLGTNASSDSFYSSQGRCSNMILDVNDNLLGALLKRNVKTIEMETAQLFHLAACIPEGSPTPILASAIHIIIANRPKNQFLVDKKDRLYLDQKAAQVALETLASLTIEGVCLPNAA